MSSDLCFTVVFNYHFMQLVFNQFVFRQMMNQDSKLQYPQDRNLIGLNYESDLITERGLVDCFDNFPFLISHLLNS